MEKFHRFPKEFMNFIGFSAKSVFFSKLRGVVVVPKIVSVTTGLPRPRRISPCRLWRIRHNMRLPALAGWHRFRRWHRLRRWRDSIARCVASLRRLTSSVRGRLTAIGTRRLTAAAAVSWRLTSAGVRLLLTASRSVRRRLTSSSSVSRLTPSSSVSRLTPPATVSPQRLEALRRAHRHVLPSTSFPGAHGGRRRLDDRYLVVLVRRTHLVRTLAVSLLLLLVADVPLELHQQAHDVRLEGDAKLGLREVVALN